MATPRAMNVTYEQQLRHLPKLIKRKTLASIFKTLIMQLQPVKIARIIHDKDIDEEGEPIEKHVNIVLQFKNTRTLEQLTKLINEPQVSAFQQWRGNVNNAYSYLVRQTNEEQEKYLYPIEEVKEKNKSMMFIRKSKLRKKKSGLLIEKPMENLLQYYGFMVVQKQRKLF